LQTIILIVFELSRHGGVVLSPGCYSNGSDVTRRARVLPQRHKALLPRGRQLREWPYERHIDFTVQLLISVCGGQPMHCCTTNLLICSRLAWISSLHSCSLKASSLASTTAHPPRKTRVRATRSVLRMLDTDGVCRNPGCRLS
jgi:hypothetical protein